MEVSIMRHAAISLDVIQIANPCPACWEKMRGDEQVRFCTECNLHVYNLSAMTREETEPLLVERGEARGRLCVRLYKAGRRHGHHPGLRRRLARRGKARRKTRGNGGERRALRRHDAVALRRVGGF
jgi:hypothetical protein